MKMLDDILQNTLSMMNPVIPCAGLMESQSR